MQQQPRGEVTGWIRNTLPLGCVHKGSIMTVNAARGVSLMQLEHFFADIPALTSALFIGFGLFPRL